MKYMSMELLKTHKRRGISWSSERLLASQVGVSSMELVS